MDNEKLDMTADNNKNMGSNRRKLHFALCAMVIIAGTVAYKVNDTLISTLQNLWIQYQSPYPIREEFILNRRLVAHRNHIHILSFGLLDDWVQIKHQAVYEHVKNKLPANDIAWIEYWYDSEARFWPHQDKENADKRVPLALEKMALLKDGQSKIGGFNDSLRYLIWSDLARYVSRNVYVLSNTMKEKHGLLIELLSEVEKVLRQLDISSIQSFDEGHVYNLSLFAPLELLNTKRMVLEYLLYMEHKASQLDCKSWQMRSARDAVSEINKLISAYDLAAFNFSKYQKDKFYSLRDEANINIIKFEQWINNQC